MDTNAPRHPMSYDELLATLQQHADADKAAGMAAYMRDKFVYLGIPTPLRRKLGKPFIRQLSAQPGIDWAFIEACWQSPYRELHYVALDYLSATRSHLMPRDIPKLKQLAITHPWWDTIDFLDRIIGDIALRHPTVNKTLLAWSVDDNIWLRRIAIDHQRLRKEKTDTELLERILCNNLGQKEFFINKAIGWALRDYSKTNPDWVRDFIARHRPQMASLSIREASKYL